MITRPEDFHDGRDYHEFELATSTATTEVGLDKMAGLSAVHLVENATTVAVVGPPNTPVDVYRMYPDPATVLGSGVTDGMGKATVSVAVPLRMGEVYGAKALQVPAPSAPFLTPFRVWGSDDPLPSATLTSLPSGVGLWSYPNHNQFALPLWVDVDPQATAPVSYPATLAVGTEADVQVVNGKYFLAAPVTFSTTLEIWKADEQGFASVDLPTPPDEGLAGILTLYQWWIFVTPTDIRLSRIYGIVMRDALWVPPGAEEWWCVTKRATEEKNKSKPLRWNRQRVQAWYAWLRGCGGRVDEGRLVRTVLGLLLRRR